MSLMSTRAAPFVTTLSILAFMVWLALSTGGPSDRDESRAAPGSGTSTAESASPCDAPVGWHLADIDPRFGLSAAEVAEATREAARLWEDAVARSLFIEDTRGGLPVRLVYDHRQVR